MKLYRFEHSNYCHKVQMALDLLGRRYELVEVPYGDRAELLSVSGGLRVPVLVLEGGEVVADSRRICARLVAGEGGERLVPPALAGPIWAYADFCDGALEDVVFRLASPGIRRRLSTVADRALFTLVKERRYGEGCLEAWERDQASLADRAREALAPTLETLQRVPFVFGDAPTLADAALYGQLAMLRIAGGEVRRLGKELVGWMERLPGGGD